MPPPEREAVEGALLTAVREALAGEDGIVRAEWSALPGHPPTLHTSTRPLGPDPDRFVAACSAQVHPGPGERRHAKCLGPPEIERARAESAERGLDEVLLFDASGLLVEGARSNLLLVTASGRLATPALALGAVEGLGLAIVRESGVAPDEVRVRREDVCAARELLACNAVRGVVPIVRLDGEPIADGRPGPWARRLGAISFGRRRAEQGPTHGHGGRSTQSP